VRREYRPPALRAARPSSLSLAATPARCSGLIGGLVGRAAVARARSRAQAAISAVLSGGGAHYVSEEFAARHGEEAPLSAQDALKSCFGAMGIYAVFLVFCGFRVYSMNAKGASKQQLIDDE